LRRVCYGKRRDTPAGKRKAHNARQTQHNTHTQTSGRDKREKSKSAEGKARKLIVVFIIKFVVIRGKPSRLAHTFNRGGMPSLAGNALSSGWRIMGAHRVNKGRAAHRSTGRRGRKA